MSETDLEAYRKWKQIPEQTRKALLSNVFCINCFETTIVDYTFHDDEAGILLKGQCKHCGDEVARLVEDA